MGQTHTSANASAPGPSASTLHDDLVIYRYGDRSAILPRCSTYELAVFVAREHFNITGDITLGTILEGSTESYEISHEAWDIMFCSLRVIVVLVSPGTDSAIVDGPGLSSDRNTRTRDAAGGQWETVLEAGKKPVIYLYPPTAMDVSVRLGLIPAWEFSAVYPLTVIKKLEPIKGQVGQHIEWNVYANPSGLLRDNLSGKEITYLFWEAEARANSSQFLSTPPYSRVNSPALNSRPAECLAFDPTSPQVTPDESILLPANKIPSYLDGALTVLGLHTEARTSFITFWLPSIMKHPHVALRFLPQASYEAAAPMEVTPRPDVVTRIFMVARGLDNEEAEHEEWADASSRASQPVEIWQKMVGMSLERASDPTIFRVLEWGGMFVN